MIKRLTHRYLRRLVVWLSQPSDEEVGAEAVRRRLARVEFNAKLVDADGENLVQFYERALVERGRDYLLSVYRDLWTLTGLGRVTINQARAHREAIMRVL